MNHHAVIIRFHYAQDGRAPLVELERALEAAISQAGVGEFDGNDVPANCGDGYLYLYGPDADAIFHEPFTLKLHVDKEHFYEEKFRKIPYVHSGPVYLFKGDEFGITLDIQNNSVRSVKYQKDVKKADLTLKFTQEVQPDGTAMMMLDIHNNTKHTLNLDALMTVPSEKAILKTTISSRPARPFRHRDMAASHRPTRIAQHPNRQMTASAN